MEQRTVEDKLREGLIARQKQLQQIKTIVTELQECWKGHIKFDWCPCEEPTEEERENARRWFELLEMLWVMFGLEWNPWTGPETWLKSHRENLKKMLNKMEG